MEKRKQIPETRIMQDRGILLHISSLPGKEGIGTLGNEAHKFADYLADANQSLWQILPVNMTNTSGNPFIGPSVFAGNPHLISLEKLVEKGDLGNNEYSDYLKKCREFKSLSEDNYINYDFLNEFKLGIDDSGYASLSSPLRLAYNGFRHNQDKERIIQFEIFCENNSYWLNDFALFMSLKEKYGFMKQWNEWSEPDRLRQEGYETKISKSATEFHKYLQFVFDEQMSALHKKAKERGIKLIGDIPIYTAYDSADVWANMEIFHLDADGGMKFVAAVPPDGFSKDGQLWGNPLYKWGAAGTDEDHVKVYSWWASRIKKGMEHHDLLKIDHFRGFVEYGIVNADADNAREVRWIKGPGKEFFDYLESSIKTSLPVIAEDLGFITHDVKSLLEELGLPGMRVLLFADLEDEKDYHLPHNSCQNSVLYTGTHDNETLMQCLNDTMDATQKGYFLNYLSRSSEQEANWRAVDLLYISNAGKVIIPMQDIFGLGKEARMNNPYIQHGNWRWRMTSEQFNSFGNEIGEHLRALSRDKVADKNKE